MHSSNLCSNTKIKLTGSSFWKTFTVVAGPNLFGYNWKTKMKNTMVIENNKAQKNAVEWIGWFVVKINNWLKFKIYIYKKSLISMLLFSIYSKKMKNGY